MSLCCQTQVTVTCLIQTHLSTDELRVPPFVWRLNSSDRGFVLHSGVCQVTACRRHLQVLHKVAALGVREDLSAQVMNEREV